MDLADRSVAVGARRSFRPSALRCWKFTFVLLAARWRILRQVRSVPCVSNPPVVRRRCKARSTPLLRLPDEVPPLSNRDVPYDAAATLARRDRWERYEISDALRSVGEAPRSSGCPRREFVRARFPGGQLEIEHFGGSNRSSTPGSTRVRCTRGRQAALTQGLALLAPKQQDAAGHYRPHASPDGDVDRLLVLHRQLE